MGFADDLRSRKIHNVLLIGLLLLSALVIFTLRGISGVGYGLGCSALAVTLTLPLVYMRALGGGDMKLFAVFAFTSTPIAVMWVLAYSFVAGALIGLVRAALGGNLMAVIRSTATIATSKHCEPTGEFNIPFSAALLLGWLTYASNGWGLWL